jgi:hypothetical protein
MIIEVGKVSEETKGGGPRKELSPQGQIVAGNQF